jgi:anti-sigma B factor antagonist
MSAPLRIAERRMGTVTVFELSGGLVYDQGTKLLRDVLTKAVAAGTRACLVDMHGITYLDSGGVGSLVSVYRHVMRHGGQLKIVRPSPSAARVLDITKLTTVFEIFPDEPSALDSFRI